MEYNDIYYKTGLVYVYIYVYISIYVNVFLIYNPEKRRREKEMLTENVHGKITDSSSREIERGKRYDMGGERER